MKCVPVLELYSHYIVYLGTRKILFEMKPTRTLIRNLRLFSTNPQSRLENVVGQHLPLSILSEDEQIMKETVSRLAREQILPQVRDMEQKGRISDSVIKMLFENGLMGIEVGTEFGGAGCNMMTTILTVEEISKVDPAVAVLVDIQNTLVNGTIKKLGTDQQKRSYLPQLTTNMCSSFCLTEPTSGTDAFALKTTAKRVGEDYVINGTKQWISNSDVAGLFLVMANADPSKGYKGITCFLVERDSPGLSVGPPEKKLGICASGTCAVTFEDVRVPHTSILGEFGQGYKIAAGFLNEGRIGIAAQMVGIAQGCYNASVPYTLERKQFGRAVFEFQAVQHQVAMVATQIECARLLTYNAARLVEAGEDFVKQAAMAKYFAAEVAQNTCVKCIDWMGAIGFTKGLPQEKFYRDVKIGSIYEGTANVQLSTIAKYIRKEFGRSG